MLVTQEGELLQVRVLKRIIAPQPQIFGMLEVPNVTVEGSSREQEAKVPGRLSIVGTVVRKRLTEPGYPC